MIVSRAFFIVRGSKWPIIQEMQIGMVGNTISQWAPMSASHHFGGLEYTVAVGADE
jgi:hypothetical protein